MNSNGYLDYKQNQLSFESMAYESINKPRIPELLGSNVPENFKQHVKEQRNQFCNNIWNIAALQPYPREIASSFC